MEEFQMELYRYGQSVEISGKTGCTTAKAFVQPQGGSKNASFTMTELGEADERLWKYIGGAEVAILRDDRLVCGGKSFVVLNSEDVCFGEKIHHKRALLKLLEGQE